MYSQLQEIVQMETWDSAFAANKVNSLFVKQGWKVRRYRVGNSRYIYAQGNSKNILVRISDHRTSKSAHERADFNWFKRISRKQAQDLCNIIDHDAKHKSGAPIA